MRGVVSGLAALLLIVGALGGCESYEANPGADRVARADRQADAEPAAVDRAKRERAAPEPPRTWLVTRVVDGDTIDLGNGATVRLIGIDTPETGECGYQAAADHLARLVLGKRVVLTRVDEHTDQYGRWLRYVDVGRTDAGLRQIRGGFAVARYDSRDGYGWHPRQAAYIVADRAVRDPSCPRPVPFAGGGGGCAPGYSPCVPPYPPDLDCADVDGPVTIAGSDPHRLDGDGDGAACEWG